MIVDAGFIHVKLYLCVRSKTKKIIIRLCLITYYLIVIASFTGEGSQNPDGRSRFVAIFSDSSEGLYFAVNFVKLMYFAAVVIPVVNKFISVF